MPMGFNNGVAVAEVPAEVELPAGVVSGATPTKELEPKVVRSVTRKHYKITEAERRGYGPLYSLYDGDEASSRRL